MTDPISVKRAFEVDNARNLNRDEVVHTFVPSEAFWRLLSPKNHIVVGARGSGKTALAKMLSHSHLSKFDDDRARIAIKSKKFIGIYVPARISWMGAHAPHDKIHTQHDLDTFVWKLNLATCFAFLETIESCLAQYFSDSLQDRLRKEVHAARRMSDCWFGSSEFSSLRDLRDALLQLDFKKKIQLTQKRISGNTNLPDDPIGIHLHTDLFDPLRTAIERTRDILGFSAETAWLLCLDEIEFLSFQQHKLINTFLREHSGNLYFKLTTMPYRHYTLETQMAVPLNAGDDFQYLYLDNHHIKLDQLLPEEGPDALPVFASRIFQARLAASGLKQHARKTLRQMLGPSVLLDSEREDWGEDSHNLGLLLEYCNDSTIERAKKLLARDPRRFRDQIGRKIHGALILKNAVKYSSGRSQLSVYSGATLLARCSDGNPRTLITLINSLLWASNLFRATKDTLSLRPIAPQIQTRVLTEFSGTFLRRIQGEEAGGELYNLISQIGEYMRRRLHGAKVGTDFITSIDADLSHSDSLAKLVKASVGLGYLYPSLNPKDTNRLPLGRGTFQLGFVLAPYFKLLPRKGKARDLASVLNELEGYDVDSAQGPSYPQGSLF